MKKVFLMVLLLSSAAWAHAQYGSHVARKVKPHLELEGEEGDEQVFLVMDVPLANYLSHVSLELEGRKKTKKERIQVESKHYQAANGRIHLVLPIGQLGDFEARGRNTLKRLTVRVFNHSDVELHKADHTQELVQRVSKYTNKNYKATS